MIYRITIPKWRPTRDNQLSGGSHWAKKNRLKKTDKDFVATYAMRLGIPPATGKRRVSLEITLSGRQKETDPWAYCKSLLDALVACRMLVDDSARFVEFVPATYTRGDDGGTVIVLEDLE
jgi:hypothetical protein